MEVTYRRNLHKSYMCIKGQEAVQEEYELVMLESQKIPRLLPVQTSVADGVRSYLYEISGKQQIGDYLSGKKMDYRILCKLLFSIQELCSVLPEYLLSEERICLETEFIYVNLEDGSLDFTYLPFWEESLPESFEHFMEWVLRKIDHQDHAATELGYRVYQACTQENANMQKMLETALERIAMERIGQETADIGKLKEKKETDRGQSDDRCGKTEESHLESKKNSDENRKTEWNERTEKRNSYKAEKKKEFATKKQEMYQEMMNRIRGLLPSMDELSADKLLTNIKEKICTKRSAIKKSSAKKTEKKGSKGQASSYQEDKQEFTVEREVPSHPTEILGIHRQEPAGKLIYQGIHGCTDFIIEGEEYLLGKNGQQANGVIDAEGVSRLHARISKEGNIYYIEDLNSTNGTYLNEIPLEYHQKKALDKNDRIRFAAEEYVFC